MQVLSAHSSVNAGGELTALAQFAGRIATNMETCNPNSLRNLATHYLQKIKIRADTGSFVTDKMPANFRFIPLIHAVFPEA